MALRDRRPSVSADGLAAPSYKTSDYDRQQYTNERERPAFSCLPSRCRPWRKVSARPRRTKVDWALEMEELLRTRYADIEKVKLVCDNLNTHTRGAFYPTVGRYLSPRFGGV